MNKDIILEINRIKEVMGLLNEQQTSNVTPDSWKEYESGKPYALFMEKATKRSKINVSKATGDIVLDWKSVAEYKIPVAFLTDRGKAFFSDWVRNPIIDGHVYVKSVDSRYFGKINKNRYRNPDFNEAAKSALAQVPTRSRDDGGDRWGSTLPGITPEVKLGFMIKIAETVNEDYRGNYNRANRQITSITVSKGKVTEIETEEEDQPPTPNAFFQQVDLYGKNSDVFPNNTWDVGNDLKNQVKQIKDSIISTLKANPGTVAKIPSSFALPNGTKSSNPYTISTSASRIRNTGQAENMSFAELSQKRAASVAQYINQELSSLVKLPEPVINANGEHGDGSSGPNPPSPYKFFNKQGKLIASGDEGRNDYGEPIRNLKEYEQHKYCKFSIVVMFESESVGTSPEGSDATHTIGEWRLRISRKKKFKIKIRWPWEWDWSWLKSRQKEQSGGGKQPCVAYN